MYALGMCRLVALVAVLAAGWLVAPAAAAVQLRRCGGAQCGTVTRALDPQRPQRAQDRRRVPALPGGGQGRADRRSSPSRAGPGTRRPGRARSTAAIFGPLLKTRDLLLVDNRGTGGSALIDCRSVQSFAGRTSGPAFARRAARCAAEIERRYGDPEPVRHRLRRRRSRRRDPGARLRARRPVRRLVRHVLRAGLRRAAPVGAALGDARLRLPAARHGPVVRVVGGDAALRARASSRRARRRGSANCSSASARQPITRRHAGLRRFRRSRSASTRARCRTSSRTRRATR